MTADGGDALRTQIERLHCYQDGHQYFIDGFEECRARVLEVLDRVLGPQRGKHEWPGYVVGDYEEGSEDAEARAPEPPTGSVVTPDQFAVQLPEHDPIRAVVEGRSPQELSVSQKMHTLVAEVRRCIGNDHFKAHRKLDALDVLIREAWESRPAPPPLDDLRYCKCADPENCREVIPGYVCRKGHAREARPAPPLDSDFYFEVSERELRLVHARDFLWRCFLQFRDIVPGGENLILMWRRDLNKLLAIRADPAAHGEQE